MRKRLGWRADQRRYNDISRALARATQREIMENREALAAEVCPDGDACPERLCVERRNAARAGKSWRELAAMA